MKDRPAAARRAPLRLAALALLASLLAVAAASLPAAALAASPGQLYAFGENGFGQLGNETNNGTGEPNPTPTLATLPGATGPVTESAAGEYHSLALTSSGQLYAFGGNYYGQLGNAINTGNSEPNPTPTLVTLPGATGPVTEIAAGAEHSLALTSTGQLYAFGYNRYGQLGVETNVGTGEPNTTPTLVTLPGATGPVTEIAAGSSHSLALTSTGQLYAFGQNRYGQLGNETNVGTLEPNPTPTLVTLPGASGAVTEIAAGSSHSLALTSTGQLYGFGYNYYGQLGIETNSGTSEPNPTPTLVTLPGASGAVTEIAVGEDHGLAVTSTGQLYAFGNNRYGQLGNATNSGTSEPNPTPTLVDLPGASGAPSGIAGGAFHSLAVTSSGQLFAFGENDYGQLGIETNSGTSEPNPTPTLVDLGTGTTVDTIAAGSRAYHSLVIIANLAVSTDSLPAATVGTPYSAAASASGGTAPYTWQADGLPAGLSIDPASGEINGTPSAAGSSEVTLTVSDRFGILASSEPLTLSVAEAPSEAGGSGGGGTPSGGSTPSEEGTPSAPKPQLTKLSQSRSRWRLGGKLAKTSALASKQASAKVGTTFRFRLNEKAKVILVFKIAKGKGFKQAGTLSFAGKQGANKVAFQGRISRKKKLRPGKYKLIASAKHGSKRSKTKTLRFTIVG